MRRDRTPKWKSFCQDLNTYFHARATTDKILILHCAYWYTKRARGKEADRRYMQFKANQYPNGIGHRIQHAPVRVLSKQPTQTTTTITPYRRRNDARLQHDALKIGTCIHTSRARDSMASLVAWYVCSVSMKVCPDAMVSIKNPSCSPGRVGIGGRGRNIGGKARAQGEQTTNAEANRGRGQKEKGCAERG